MKKTIVLAFAAIAILSACARLAEPIAAPTQAPPPVMHTASPLPPTATLAPSATPVPTDTPVPTPNYPPAGLGPGNFPADVDPLTGLKVADAGLLDRRPVVIKVENLPREHRPQFGLSLADLVFEYYTEQGGTRFAAVFYGQDAEQVGPIRSGRFFDTYVVQMVRGVFIFGSAYTAVWNRFVNSDFADRLVLESEFSKPALFRVEPQGRDLLMANTKELGAYLRARAIDNTRQVLDGMFFQMQPPAGGSPAAQVYVRYSGAIYNRWDYDTSTGRYLRFEDAQNDINRNNEVYLQLNDQLTGTPVAAQTVVMMCVPHQYVFKSDEIEVVDMVMDPAGGTFTSCDGKQYPGGTGPAWVARDGMIYKVIYQLAKKDAPLSLMTEDGQPFPYKPGQTWFEVLGASSKVEQMPNNAWRFTFVIAP